MSRNLRLQVIMGAVDRVTRPLRKINQGSRQVAQNLRATKEQLSQVNQQQKDVSGYRRTNIALRENVRALRDARSRQHQYTQQLEQQRNAHVNVKSGLTAARREYDRLARAVTNARQPNAQLSAELDRARVRLEGQQRAFDQSTRAIRQYRDRTRHADEQVKQLTRTHATNTERLAGLRQRLDNAGISTDNLGRSARQLRQQESQLNATLEQQQQRLNRVAAQQRRLTEARERHQRAMGNIGRMQGVGAGMFGSGLAKGFMAQRLLTPGVSWAEQMSTLQAVGRFTADDDRYQALRAQSRELGGSTAFSATEVGGGQEFLLRAGMSAEAIQASMRDVLDLALANNTELARAADIASNIAGTFKVDMEAEGAMARVADILSGTASRANVNLEMLGNTMKYLGGAEDLQLTMEQAAAMAGMLGNIGIQGSQAGTTMRAMMNRLTNPAKKGAAAIATIGLEVADANGNMRAMPDILRDISTATADLGNVERKAVMQDIFGAEAGSGMAELVNAMGEGQLDEILRALGDNYGENAQMASTMADSIAGDLKNLRSAWEEVGISITDTNDGPLRDLVQSVTGALRWIAEWIKANPELASTIAKVAGGLILLTTVGGALTMMLASILGPFVIMRHALTMIGIRSMGLGKAFAWLAKAALPALVAAFKAMGAAVLANPILAVVAALAMAGLYVWQNWETLGPKFAALWQGIREGLGAAWEGIKAAFEGGIAGVTRLLIDWSPLGILWRGISTALGALGVELPTTLSDLGGAIIDGMISGITGALGRLREAVTGMGGSVIGWFKETLGINSPSRIFAEFGGNLLEGLVNGIDEKWQALKDAIGNTAGAVTNWFKERLGINSPSRVFAELGGHTMDGYQQGLERSERGPLGELADFAKRLTLAGAGFALGGASAAAGTLDAGRIADVPIDTRPPLSAAAGGTGITIHGGINIEINAAPGMDEQALARYVNAEVQRAIERAARDQAARQRSAFHDND